MKLTRRSLALGIALISLFGAVIAPSVAARGVQGLRVLVYNQRDLDDYSQVRPWLGANKGTLCKKLIVDRIEEEWDEDPIFGCNEEDVIVNYRGFLTVPYTGVYTFKNSSDDGFRMTLDRRVVISNWVEQGSDLYNSSGTISLVAGRRYAIEVWYFQNEGGAASKLFYQWDNWPTFIVPNGWYSY